MANKLDEIVERKREEIADGKSQIPLESMMKRARESDPPRNFFRAITERRKRRSASAGAGALLQQRAG